jgi:uncharacterized protein (TIGR02466 family)
MSVRRLFPTSFYAAPLQRTGLKAFNTRLLRECLQLRRDDRAGVAWSKERYPGGYTSYGSVNRMQRFSPTFAALERKLDRHVRAFARRLDFDLSSRSLAMTDCWVNIMPRLDDQRHVLRAGAARQPRAQIRGSEARAHDGRAADARARAP